MTLPAIGRLIKCVFPPFFDNCGGREEEGCHVSKEPCIAYAREIPAYGSESEQDRHPDLKSQVIRNPPHQKKYDYHVYTPQKTEARLWSASIQDMATWGSGSKAAMARLKRFYICIVSLHGSGNRELHCCLILFPRTYGPETL